MINNEKVYHGRISYLELPVEGTSEQQEIIDYANVTLQAGATLEKYGKITRDVEIVKKYLDNIKNFPDLMSAAIDTALDSISNYIKTKKSVGYDIEANKVCYSTLKFLKYIYYLTNDAKITHNKRVTKLFWEIEKICEETYNEVWTIEDITNPYNEKHGSRRSKSLKPFDDKDRLKQDQKYDDGFGNANRNKVVKIRKELDRLDNQDIEEACIEEI